MRRHRLMPPTRRARRGVARDGPCGELALPSLLRREFASLLQLLRGADRVIPRQHVTGAARVLLFVEEIGVVRSSRGGPGLGPAAARVRSLGAVEGVGAHGADGLRGWLPRGSARELARPTTLGGTGRDRVRSWRVVPYSLRRGAYGESLDGRETRARTTGNSPSNARTEREHRPRARVSRRGWTERAGHRSRTAPARAREVAEKARCERSGRTGRGSPWDEKGAASAGYAPARIRDERAGDSPHGATFVAVTLHVERILVEEHVDACEAPPRPRTTVVRPDEGARAFPMVDRSTRDERVLGLIPGTRSL